MRIENDVKLDFKDVLIRPKRSTLSSRNEVDVHRTFRFLHTGAEWSGFPLIAANMDVTGTMTMAAALGRHHALTALHKHYPESRLAEFFAGADGAHAFYSIGTTETDLVKLAAVRQRAPLRFLCIDVANGYAEKFLDTVKRVRDENPHSVIMAGNVVTGDMTEALVLAGADIVKIGIGPGSAIPSFRPSSNALTRRTVSRVRSAPTAAARFPATSPRPMGRAPTSSCSGACSRATTNATGKSATKSATAKKCRSACRSTACPRRRR